MYIRFDLASEAIDTWTLEDLVFQWAQDRQVKYTKKIIWNHRRREYRVCFLESQHYTWFALTWPDWAPEFQVLEP